MFMFLFFFLASLLELIDLQHAAVFLFNHMSSLSLLVTSLTCDLFRLLMSFGKYAPESRKQTGLTTEGWMAKP